MSASDSRSTHRYERDPQNYEGRTLMWTGDPRSVPPKRSLSAETVAVLRAAHQRLDDPVIHEDPLAMGIIGAEGRRWLEENPAAQEIAWVRTVRNMLAARARLCEEGLLRAVERGTTQYVVLGAGLDTSAYRLTQLAGRATVFEVDEPATQAWKIERLQEAGIERPAHLRFVPVDFTRDSLAEELAAAGFVRTSPAYFSWLGVTYYLPLEAILDTMRFIAGQEAASEVILDVALAESVIQPEGRDHYQYFRQAMEKTAEPWITWLDTEDFRDRLLDLGFTSVDVMDSNAAMRPFVGDVPFPSLMAFIAARKD